LRDLTDDVGQALTTQPHILTKRQSARWWVSAWFGTLLRVAPRTTQAAMRHSSIDLTMNVYTDPKAVRRSS